MIKKAENLLELTDALWQWKIYKVKLILRGHVALDPITALLNFFTSAQGQVIVQKILAITEEIVMLIADMVKTIHTQHATDKMIAAPVAPKN